MTWNGFADRGVALLLAISFCAAFVLVPDVPRPGLGVGCAHVSCAAPAPAEDEVIVISARSQMDLLSLPLRP